MTLVLLLSLLGGLILLDKWALGEFGISQPLVACPLIGLIFGDFATGLSLGIALELVWIAGLPLGGKVLPDGQAAGVVAMASYILGRSWTTPERLLFASLLFAALASLLGGYTDVVVRRFNSNLFRRAMNQPSAGRIARYHFLGLVTSFLRGFFLVLIILLIFFAASPLFKFLPQFSHAELLSLPLGIGIASLFVLFFARRRIPFILTGFVVLGTVWLLFKL
jgi:PTS system mannose-specific IIC component